jgi:hypothetical protein
MIVAAAADHYPYHVQHGILLAQLCERLVSYMGKAKSHPHKFETLKSTDTKLGMIYTVGKKDTHYAKSGSWLNGRIGVGCIKKQRKSMEYMLIFPFSHLVCFSVRSPFPNGRFSRSIRKTMPHRNFKFHFEVSLILSHI